MSNYIRKQPQKIVIHTTLLEIIEAISEEVRPEEKELLPEIIAKILSICQANCRVEDLTSC